MSFINSAFQWKEHAEIFAAHRSNLLHVPWPWPLRLHFSSSGIDGILSFFFNYVARSLELALSLRAFHEKVLELEIVCPNGCLEWKSLTMPMRWLVVIGGKTENTWKLLTINLLFFVQTALQFVACLVIPSVLYRRQVAMKLWCFQFSTELLNIHCWFQHWNSACPAPVLRLIPHTSPLPFVPPSGYKSQFIWRSLS